MRFVATRLFRLLLPSFGFNAPPGSYSLPFLSIPSVRYCFPSSQVLHFVTSVLSFRPFENPIRYFFPFVPPLTVRLILELLRRISFLSFITFFLSFHLSPFIRYFLPFVSTLSFHWLLPSVRFNSDMPFFTASLRFKSFMSLRPSFRFTSPYPFVTSSFCATSYSHLQPNEWLQVAASGCEWLHAACWWKYMAELAPWKNRFCLKGGFFQVCRLDRKYFIVPHAHPWYSKLCGKPYTTHVFNSVRKILGRSINGGRMVEHWKEDLGE